jgi:Zn-finger protein
MNCRYCGQYDSVSLGDGIWSCNVCGMGVFEEDSDEFLDKLMPKGAKVTCSSCAKLKAEKAELLKALDIIASEALSYQRRTGRTVTWLEMAMDALAKAKA